VLARLAGGRRVEPATLEGRVEMGEKVIINIKTFADGHRPPDQVVPGML
jgi:glyoxylate reductase